MTYLRTLLLTVLMGGFFMFAATAQEVGNKHITRASCATEKDARRLSLLAETRGDEGYSSALNNPEVWCMQHQPISVTLTKKLWTMKHQNGAQFTFWVATDMLGTEGYVWILTKDAAERIGIES